MSLLRRLERLNEANGEQLEKTVPTSQADERGELLPSPPSEDRLLHLRNQLLDKVLAALPPKADELSETTFLNLI